MSTCCLLLCMLYQGQAAQPIALQLSASKQLVYPGELIDITLTLPGAVKPNSELCLPAELMLFEKDQTMLAWSKPARTGDVALSYQGKTVYARQVDGKRAKLTWKYLVTQPDDLDANERTLGPVKVGMLDSNALVLEVQRLPALAPAPAIWDIGVGSYRVTVRWLEQQAVMGQETPLVLTVEGKGSLAAIPAPAVRRFPGWEGDRVSLGDVIRTQQQSALEFRIPLRPRQLSLQLAPISIRFFDPERQVVVTRQVAIPPLAVVSSATARRSGHSVGDALQALSATQREALAQHASSHGAAWQKWFEYMLWLPVAGAAAFVGKQLADSWKPRWLVRWRWQQVVRASERAWKQAPVTPARLRAVLAQLLSKRNERAVVPEYASLHQAALLSGLAKELTPLLHQAEIWEFGPDAARHQSEMMQAMDAFFVEARRR